MTKNNNFKNDKYKYKFIKSINKKNFDKSNMYFKKYLQYNSKSILKKNNVIKISSLDEFNSFIDNIRNLFVTIYGKEITNKIFFDFDDFLNDNKISYPVEINLDLLLNKIFTAIYGENNDILKKILNNNNNSVIEEKNNELINKNINNTLKTNLVSFSIEEKNENLLNNNIKNENNVNLLNNNIKNENKDIKKNII